MSAPRKSQLASTGAVILALPPRPTGVASPGDGSAFAGVRPILAGGQRPAPMSEKDAAGSVVILDCASDASRDSHAIDGPGAAGAPCASRRRETGTACFASAVERAGVVASGPGLAGVCLDARGCTEQPHAGASPSTTTSTTMHIGIIHCESPAAGAAFVEFHARQRDCYAAFGAAAAAPAVLPDPALSVLIAARTEDGDMVAGIRLQRRAPHAPLPLEVIAGRFGLDVPVPGGVVAEAGGLWATRRLRGTGIGRELMEALIAVAPLLGIDTVMVLAHQFHRFLRPAGFVPVPGLPRLIYPDDRYVSELQTCAPLHVPWATRDRRDTILRLRQEWAAHGLLRCDTCDVHESFAERNAS
jgi:GNAT superfamily N-acetyltransferase